VSSLLLFFPSSPFYIICEVYMCLYVFVCVCMCLYVFVCVCMCLYVCIYNVLTICGLQPEFGKSVLADVFWILSVEIEHEESQDKPTCFKLFIDLIKNALVLSFSFPQTLS